MAEDSVLEEARRECNDGTTLDLLIDVGLELNAIKNQGPGSYDCSKEFFRILTKQKEDNFIPRKYKLAMDEMVVMIEKRQITDYDAIHEKLIFDLDTVQAKPDIEPIEIKQDLKALDFCLYFIGELSKQYATSRSS